MDNRIRASVSLSPRPSSPAPGRSLGSTVGRAAAPLHHAIEVLAKAATRQRYASVQHIFSCTPYGPGHVVESDAQRTAWFLLAVTLIHALADRSTRPHTIRETLEWFFGDVTLSSDVMTILGTRFLSHADHALGQIHITQDLFDLLPYVIEPHGHVSRSRLEACELARETRSRKRKEGVYYTPSDVADFMVGTLFDGRSESTWLDPACGTGVFLKSVVEHHRSQASFPKGLAFISKYVFGIDKSALATDLCAFVLLAQCIETQKSESPFRDWKQIKKNIVCMDSLYLRPPRDTRSTQLVDATTVEVSDFFPRACEDGFDRVVMNPPYADIQVTNELKDVWHSFADLASLTVAGSHLAFSEMLWRFVRDDGQSAAVLPLSVASSTSAPFRRLRRALVRTSGTKDFLFFDREPQALFGEDIKTRNAIVFRRPSQRSIIRTSRLLKWTAPQRASIFTVERTTPIESNCELFVPKLGSPKEADAYNALSSVKPRVVAKNSVLDIGRITLAEAREGKAVSNGSAVFVSGTAYNFLNCFFSEGIPKDSAPLSSSPITTVSCNSPETALAAYAILSSRLAFWLWHVEGDGFHVTTSFLERLSLWSALANTALHRGLSEHGERAWSRARQTSLIALNGGKRTYSFHCGHDEDAVLNIDRMLINHFQLDPTFSKSLCDFVHATVSIDGRPRARAQMELKRAV